jgi:8-oxo-dGTP diphosphatase
MRTYEVAPGRLAAFTEFFEEHLLSVQLRHGARLVGRWATADGGRVISLWVYDDADHLAAVEQLVRDDPASLVAVRRRIELEPLVFSTEEMLLDSTVPLADTELAHLEKGA